MDRTELPPSGELLFRVSVGGVFDHHHIFEISDDALACIGAGEGFELPADEMLDWRSDKPRKIIDGDRVVLLPRSIIDGDDDGGKWYAVPNRWLVQASAPLEELNLLTTRSFIGRFESPSTIRREGDLTLNTAVVHAADGGPARLSSIFAPMNGVCRHRRSRRPGRPPRKRGSSRGSGVAARVAISATGRITSGSGDECRS